jgi:hypothetical protein
MSDPPPEATAVCDAVLEYTFKHKHDGLTYGGSNLVTAPRSARDSYETFKLADGAPMTLEAHADATWGGRDLIGEVVTFAGAAVFQRCQKITGYVGSSQEGEGAATHKVGNTVVAVRDVGVPLRLGLSEPTFVGSDGRTNVLLATESGAAKQSKHFVRRYNITKQRQRDGDTLVGHISDAESPADFLTKWVSAAKFAASVAYVTNSKNRVAVLVPPR